MQMIDVTLASDLVHLHQISLYESEISFVLSRIFNHQPTQLN